MTYLLGTRRGLRACSSARGTFAVLALDHRQNLRRELRPDAPDSVTYDEMVEFKRAVVRALAPVATGTLLDPEIGAAQAIHDGSMPERAGLVVAVEATGYLGPETARVSRVLDGWSVEKVKRLGASAAKLLVYYHPDAPNAADQERLVADVAGACRALDLALFVEPLSFSLVAGRKLTGEARRRVVVETARRLTAIGGDILKAEFPYDAGVDRPRRLARGVPRAGRGLGRPVGAPLGRRRRGDVRGPGRDRLPSRGERRPRWSLGLGRGRDDGAPGARRLLDDDRPRAARPPRRAGRCRGSPVAGTPRPAQGRAIPGRRLVPRLLTVALDRPGPDIDILVIGEINPDIVVSDPDPVPVFGEVERLVGSVGLTVGSSSAIFACGAARLDLRVAFVGVVGDDPFGRFMLEAMAGRGIDVSACTLDPDRPTGATVILSSGHDRAILTAMGTIGALDVDAVPRIDARPRPSPPLELLLPPGDEPRAAAGVHGRGPGARDHDLVRHELGPDGAVGRRRRGHAPGLRRVPAERSRGPTDRAAGRRGGGSQGAGPDRRGRSLRRRSRRRGQARTEGGAGGRAGWESRPRPGPARGTRSTRPAPAIRSTPGSCAPGSTVRSVADALRLGAACGALSTLRAGGIDGQPTLGEATAALTAGGGA